MKLRNKTPRYYQSEAALSALDSIKNKDSHPICAIPTGAGKTIIISLIIVKFLEENPGKNILVVSHVKEILEQNYKSISEELDQKIGLYSSGLGRKDKSKVTIVGMQSGRNNPSFFDNIGLVIIDECHLVSEFEQGTYREFLSNFNCNYIGLTATPFRASGYIHLSEEALFTEVCYDLNSYENFNKLVNEEYLSKLYSKSTDLKMKIPKGVGTVGGDWVNNDLDILFNNDMVTNAALKESIDIIKNGNYKKILIFCINISHAEKVSNKINELGISCDFIHSKMEKDRDIILNKFKTGQIKALSNVNVLTTGLDVPDIDLIILLRPTKSLSLYVQMVGRGLRISEGKDHCLVLDFAENISNLGPINDLKIDQKGKPKKGGEAPVKECPECSAHNHPIAKYCIVCGYKFKFKVKLTSKSSEMSITKRKEPQELSVSSVEYSRHKKNNAMDSFKISYRVGLRKFHKWLAIESNSLYAADYAKAEIPSMIREGETINGKFTIGNLLKQQYKFKIPDKILVDTNEKNPTIEKVVYKKD